MNNPPKSPIAIIGVSARLPGSEDMDAFWEILQKGHDVISEVGYERWEPGDFYDADQSVPGKTYSTKGAFLSGVDEFDAPFFGLEAGEAGKMDPQQRLSLQEAWRTFEDAGYAPDQLRGKKIGVFIGARTGDYHDELLSRPEELEPQALMGHDTSILSARISHFLDLKGPNLTVNTACSSMGVALHLAAQSLRLGEVEMALVGGVHIMSTAQRFLMHSRSRLLSKSGQCRPFDEAADGFVLGEAVGFVLLKRRDDAVADDNDILGNILATGVNHGGYSEKGISAPNPDAQIGLIRDVLEQASISPGSIGYLEAHGTGTYKGDAMEANALREIYGAIPAESDGLAIGSVKSNVGHALTAAVLPGLLKILLCFKHGKRVRQAHFHTANELMRIEEAPFRIQTETAEWTTVAGQPRRAALSAFSYTGTNFHMLLEEEARETACRESSPLCLIPLSGRTPAALGEQVHQLEMWLSRHREDVCLEDVACTLATGRTHFAVRTAFVAGDVAELLGLLSEYQSQTEDICQVEDAQSKADALLAVLMLAGRGSEAWCATLRDLSELYQQGASIRWDVLCGDSARRISLPSYPFEKRQYRLNDRIVTDLTLFFSRRDDVYQNFLRTKKSQAKDQEKLVVQVKCGDGGFRQLGPRIYQIDPRQEADYRRLLAALGPLEGKRIQVIHLWDYECEALDFVYHGNIDRCLHWVERSLDTGARALSLLRHSLSQNTDFSSLTELYVHHGTQPQNGMVSGWLEDEWASAPKMRIRNLHLPDRTAKPAEVAAMISREIERKASSTITLSREQSAGRIDLLSDHAYLINVGNDPDGLLFVKEWASGSGGRLVVLMDPALHKEAQSIIGGEVVLLPAILSGGETLKWLEGELRSRGIAEIHGVVHLVDGSDRVDFRRNVMLPLLLDEFTKDSPLDFFLLLSLDASTCPPGGSRFADGFVELRHGMVVQRRRRGVSRFMRCQSPVALAFRTIFDTGSRVKTALASETRPAASPGEQLLETRFKRMVSEVLKRDAGTLDLAASLDSLNFNSMRVVDVIDRINRAFETGLRPSVFYKHKTLQGVFDEWSKLVTPANAPLEASMRKAIARHVGATEGPTLEPIAIIGMSGRFPMAGDLREFWENLRDGRDCIREIPHDRWDWRQAQGDARSDDERVPKWGGFIEDIDKFDPQFFGISAREAELMDPQQRLFLQCVWQTIEDAGYDPTTLAGTSTGVFVGVATCDYATILDEAGQGRQTHSPIGLFHSILANRVSYLLDLRGPSQPIDTACSSSLVAVHRAVQAIRSGQCTQALVGGVNALLTSPLFEAFQKAGMLAEDGRCKTFDESANGYVRGEGVGALLLKSLKQARADGDPIYAVIRASAENHGGRASSLTAPSPQAQAEMLIRAYQEAGIAPRTVGYIEAHGTGTPLGDPIEVDGLKQAFETLTGESAGNGMAGYCGLGSVKTNIGHLEAAAGIAGIIKVVLAMKHRTLPGNLHFTKLNPYVAVEGSPFFVVGKTQPWEAFTDGAGVSLPRRAGVSSFGFGGVNAHVVIEESIEEELCKSSVPGRDYLIVLSAKTEERLRESAAQLLRYLESSNGDGSVLLLRDVAYTLQVGRTAMEKRMGFLASSLEMVEARLKEFLTRCATLDTGTPQARLLELWLKGEPVDWQEFYTGESPLRVHLPAYPFARERYWAESSQAKRQSGWLRKQWTPCPVEPSPRKAGAVLILANRDTEALANTLARHFPESEIRFEESPEPSGKAYLGCIDLVGCGKEKTGGLAWVERLQRFVDASAGHHPVLLGVTRGLESFENASIHTSGALRAGLYRMLQSEYPAVRSRHLDADWQVDDETLAEQIAAEFWNGGEESEVCYRGGQRYRAGLQETFVKAADGKAMVFPQEQVLWITGGTRGLGSLCAAHLVRHAGVRKLVLTGREMFPPREVWAAWERKDGSVAEKIRAVQKLEAQGVEVRVLSVDLTDASALKRSLDEVKREMGPIGGVLHCAGLVDDENPAFIRKPLDGVRQVLAPKVEGTDVLMACFKDEPLAFMVFFSSVSAIVPSLAAGLSDYAMANAYLDYMAEAGGHAFPVTSIQWASWKEMGMGEVKSEAYRQSGLLSQTNAEGLRFLDQILLQKTGSVVMPVVYDPKHWTPESLICHRAKRQALAEVTPVPLMVTLSDSPALLESTRHWLAELFVRELKMAPGQLAANIPFQDYGMDSILLAQVLKQLNRKLGVRLDPSAVFEYPTLETLSTWLVRTQADALAKAFTAEAVPSVLQCATPTPTRNSSSPGNPRAFLASDIAVIGMSCRFPGANDLDAYWRLLAEGRNAIARVPEERWSNPEGFVAGLLGNMTGFDAAYFLLPEDDARAMDPQALLVLEESLNLFHHAGYTPGEIKGTAMGVYLGARTQHRPEAAMLLEARNPILAVGQNYLAANISRFFDLRGPSLVVDTACSSALVGMSLAIQALRGGEIDSAVVGGVSLLASDATHRLFQQRKLLSPDTAFHIFDQRASGVVLGEGAGLVMLKTVEQAQADGDKIYAVIKGLAINNDGRTAGPATPNMHAQKAVMQAALKRSGLRPGEVDYIEANGSGSEITDLLELKAIEAVYQEAERSPCLLGSVKPNIGHPLCAEGIAGFIKLVLMLDRRQQLPFLSGERAMTHYDLASSMFSFRRETGAWPGVSRRAALNCFADGGTNAHVILEGWKGEAGSAVPRVPIAPPVLNRRSFEKKARSPWPTAIHSTYPFLRDHAAHGEKLLPGLAYLDLLYQFFRDRGISLMALELGDLTIHHPMTARPECGIRLEIQCEEAEDGNAWNMRVEGLELLDDGSPGTRNLYITATMRRCGPFVFDETVDLNAIHAASAAVPLHESYAHFHEKGLVHTGPMKAVGTIYSTDESRTMELSLPQEAQSGANTFLFHPTLIDGAAVGAGSMFADLIAGEDRLFLPLFFGKFRASQAIHSQCVARIRKDSLRRKNELLYSDMEFFDEAGRKIAELKDFVYKLVRQSSLTQSHEATVPASALAATEDSSQGVAARLLQAVIASKLKRPAVEVDLRLGYYELGLESAMLLDVMLTLGKRLSLSLSPTLLFEYATPAELAAHLEENFPAELAKTLLAGEALEEITTSRFTVCDFSVNGLSSLATFDQKQTEVLIAELLALRLALWVEGGNLNVRAEEERLTPALREKIATNREVISRYLGQRRMLPLSRSQRRYWVLSFLQPEKSAYNNPIGMRLRGEVEIARIKQAFLILMNGHHVLRSVCPRVGKNPAMNIAPLLAEAPCEVIRLTERDAESRERALHEISARESQEPINPAVGPNVRIRIVQLAADDVAILLTAHHTVFDGYSYLPVMSEFMRIYRTLGRHELPDMESLIPYEDYTLREKATGDQKSGQFWKDHLAGAPAYVNLPLDRERAVVNAGHGDTRSIWIGSESYRAMNETIQKHRVTLFAFMLSLLKVGISGWAQQTDLVFGTTVQCRDEEGDQQVIGDFTNFIPIRSRLDQRESFEALLKSVYRTSLLCLEHKNYPYDEIVPMAGAVPRNINPVYNILVNQLPSITEMEERLSDEQIRVSVSNNRLFNQSAMLDLRFEWYEEKDGLRLICEYNTDLFHHETIEALLQRIGICLDTRAYAAEVSLQDVMPTARAHSVRQVQMPSPVVSTHHQMGSAPDEVEALVIRKILELQDISGIEALKDVSFFELGLGSFDVANLSAELEIDYPQFVVGDIFKHPTIRLLSAYLNDSFHEPDGTEAAGRAINFDLFRA